jgi:tetratricopeptide (TPR) repeat protein
MRKQFRVTVPVLACLSLLAWSNCLAKPQAATVSHAKTATDHPEFAEQIKANDFRAIDKYLNAQQAAYEKGEIDDVALYNSFKQDIFVDPKMGAHLIRWAQTYQKSYAAHVTLAYFYTSVATRSRGQKYASETATEQFSKMDYYLSKASTEQGIALSLTRKPLLSYTSLIFTAMIDGDKTAARSWMEYGNTVAPNNFIVRRAYMSALDRHWLGSDKENSQFYAECEKAALSKDQLAVLQGMNLADKADALRRESKPEESIKTFQQAIALLKDRQTLMLAPGYAMTLQAASGAYADLKQYPEALDLLNQALRLSPNDPKLLASRGWTYLSMKSLAAFPDLEFAANHGSEWAMGLLGDYYMEGWLVPQSTEKAKKYYSMAAALGNDKAISKLSQNWPDAMLNLPDSAQAYEKLERKSEVPPFRVPAPPQQKQLPPFVKPPFKVVPSA